MKAARTAIVLYKLIDKDGLTTHAFNFFKVSSYCTACSIQALARHRKKIIAGGGGGRYAAAPGRVWEGSTAQLGGREESCKLPH